MRRSATDVAEPVPGLCRGVRRASCDVAGESFGPGDVNHRNSESGALLAVNPTDPSNVIAAYEQQPPPNRSG